MRKRFNAISVTILTWKWWIFHSLSIIVIFLKPYWWSFEVSVYLNNFPWQCCMMKWTDMREARLKRRSEGFCHINILCLVPPREMEKVCHSRKEVMYDYHLAIIITLTVRPNYRFDIHSRFVWTCKIWKLNERLLPAAKLQIFFPV